MFNYIVRAVRRTSHVKRIIPSEVFKLQSHNINTSLSLRSIKSIGKTQNVLNKSPITWKTIGITTVLGGIFYVIMKELIKEKDLKMERERKRHIGKADIGGSFELLDSNEKLVKSEDFFGKWVLIYFGFTHCPDVCPEELEKLSLIVDKLDNEFNLKIQPLFITVDPLRDTPAAVGKYVKEFSDKFIGLSGSVDQISKVCKTFRVYFSNGLADEDNDYIVDHTIITYLIDPEGNFVDYYLQSQHVDAVTASIMLNKTNYDNERKDSKFPFIFKNAELSN